METNQRTEPDTQAMTVRLPRNDYRRLKILAIDERKPMVKLVQEAVKNLLDLSEAANR